MTTAPGRTSDSTPTAPLAWIDQLKAISLIWIFLNHVSERFFGFPLISNPAAGWPSLAERLAQLRPLSGHGPGDILLNLFRYLGWSGDQGVQLFLIASGFGLTWGLLRRYGRGPLPLSEFYRRRAARIFPLWWGVHLLFMGAWFLTGWGLSAASGATYASFLGIRITPQLLYYFSPAWWYIGLLLQLYLVFPVLWEGWRRIGPARLLGLSCGLAFAARALVVLLRGDWIDAWLRGAIFITRLPEFALGLCLACWLHQDRQKFDHQVRRPVLFILALAGYALGIGLSLTLLGMAVAPFLLGACLFILFYAIAGERREKAFGKSLSWIGRHSYSLYLLHHPLIVVLVPMGFGNARRAFVGVGAALFLTVSGGLALEWTVRTVPAVLKVWKRRFGLAKLIFRLAAFGLVAAAILIAGEFAVRSASPQEVLGWGERPSLEPDPIVGWHLKPSQTTRLRWASYDYTVKANELGFPGPLYDVAKKPQTVRILVSGDAFSSAEGVDTDQAWPRELERDLTRRLPSRSVQVLNFAITGYGPRQYAAVVEEFAPIYRPDLIVVGLFVNDFQDVLVSDEAFRKQIGFGLPDPKSWFSVVRLEHLRGCLYNRFIQPLISFLRRRPNSQGYFLGNFSALEKDRPDLQTERLHLAKCLTRIKTVADAIGSKVVLVMVPAPVQVCGPESLAYYPRSVDLEDTTKFDLDLPQRLTKEIADSLSSQFYDLRPVLRAIADCPYQPRNMHWLASGHKAVAVFLANAFLYAGYFGKD